MGVSTEPWEGDHLTQTAQETLDSGVSAVASRQHSELVWFALECTAIPKHFVIAVQLRSVELSMSGRRSG